MRISDWSSDVCSSDLLIGHRHERRARVGIRIDGNGRDAHAARGLDNAAGDFAAVGDQDFLEHSILPSRLREGPGEGLSANENRNFLEGNRPSPNPSRKREGGHSYQSPCMNMPDTNIRHRNKPTTATTNTIGPNTSLRRLPTQRPLP